MTILLWFFAVSEMKGVCLLCGLVGFNPFIRTRKVYGQIFSKNAVLLQERLNFESQQKARLGKWQHRTLSHVTTFLKDYSMNQVMVLLLNGQTMKLKPESIKSEKNGEYVFTNICDPIQCGGKIITTGMICYLLPLLRVAVGVIHLLLLKHYCKHALLVWFTDMLCPHGRDSLHWII